MEVAQTKYQLVENRPKSKRSEIWEAPKEAMQPQQQQAVPATYNISGVALPPPPPPPQVQQEAIQQLPQVLQQAMPLPPQVQQEGNQQLALILPTQVGSPQMALTITNEVAPDAGEEFSITKDNLINILDCQDVLDLKTCRNIFTCPVALKADTRDALTLVHKHVSNFLSSSRMGGGSTGAKTSVGNPLMVAAIAKASKNRYISYFKWYHFPTTVANGIVFDPWKTIVENNHFKYNNNRSGHISHILAYRGSRIEKVVNRMNMISIAMGKSAIMPATVAELEYESNLVQKLILPVIEVLGEVKALKPGPSALAKYPEPAWLSALQIWQGGPVVDTCQISTTGSCGQNSTIRNREKEVKKELLQKLDKNLNKETLAYNSTAVAYEQARVACEAARIVHESNKRSREEALLAYMECSKSMCFDESQ
jgi:hypothetical protein